MAEFLKKVIPISATLKTWLSQQFAPIIHTHATIENRLLVLEQGAATCGNDLPDFSRCVLMEKCIDDWSVNPGTIYKLNVPGYIYAFSNYGGYTSPLNYYFKVAAHPAYLFRNIGNNSTYGSYTIPPYANKRCVLYGDVTGGYQSQHAYPIVPGTSTYVRCCQASFNVTYDFIYFVPCKGVSNSYNQDTFFTRVGRGENHISTGAAEALITDIGSTVFAGNWQDNFTNYTLKTSDIKYMNECHYFTGNWFNGYRFYPIDPMITGYNRIYYTSSGTYIIKYVTSSVVDTIIAGLTSAQKTTVINNTSGETYSSYANKMRNKWCVLHHTWDSMTVVNKVTHAYLVARESTVDIPIGVDTSIDATGTTLWYRYSGNTYYVNSFVVDNATGKANGTLISY